MERSKIHDANDDGQVRGLDCLRFEELDQRWESLTDEEILWCAEHIRTCALGIHTPEGAARLIDLEAADVIAQLMAAEVEGLLVEAGAIERDEPDYEVHRDLHSDVHVNAAKLCHSEPIMDRMADVLAEAVQGIDFDAVVSFGWAMAAIARRMLRRSPGRRAHIVAEGYDPPVLLGRVEPKARVIVLLDVGVTGRLVRDLGRTVEQQGGRVIESLALVDGGLSLTSRMAPFRGLFNLAMDLSSESECPRSHAHPPAVFNAVRGGMTRVKTDQRSLTGHLQANPEMAELWSLVNEAGAFQQHHREGRRHYVPFIDTLALLKHPTVGPTIVTKLAGLVIHDLDPPDVLVVRNRERSRRLGKMLASALRTTGAPSPRMLLTSVRDGRFRFVGDVGQDLLSGANVLIADTATAQGETIDELALLVSEAGAAKVSAAVILSHLSEACEDALRERLKGGFARLYYFPGRPWTDSCPVCDEAERLRWVAEHLSDGPVRRAARWELAQLEHRRPGTGQLSIPFSATLLGGWPSGVVGGAASHILGAIQGNGMAPLGAPEIDDTSIPLKNRVACLRAWRRQSLGRSGSHLQQDLLQYLRRHTVEPQLWLEAAKLVADQGTSVWIDCLEEHLKREPRWLTPRVCAQLALLTFVTRRGAEQSRQRLEEVAKRYAADTAAGTHLLNALATAHPEPLHPD